MVSEFGDDSRSKAGKDDRVIPEIWVSSASSLYLFTVGIPFSLRFRRLHKLFYFFLIHDFDWLDEVALAMATISARTSPLLSSQQTWGVEFPRSWRMCLAHDFSLVKMNAMARCRAVARTKSL